MRGTFTEFDGIGYFDVAEPTNSHLEVTIMAASVHTGDPERDAENSMFDRLGLRVGARVAIEFEVSAIRRHRQPDELGGA